MEAALAVIAIAIAIVVPLGIERLKRPSMEIVPSPWTPAGPVAWTFAAVRVRNRSLSAGIGWLLTRDVAQGCVVSIDFLDWSSGTRVFDTVSGRWSSHPEPLQWVPNPPSPALAYTGGTAALAPGSGQFVAVFDPSLIRKEQDVAVSEGGEEVAVAVLRANEVFAWTSTSYAHPAWADPNLRLAQATYRVEVRVRGSNVEHGQAFKLEYLSADFTKFRLQPV